MGAVRADSSGTRSRPVGRGGGNDEDETGAPALGTAVTADDDDDDDDDDDSVDKVDETIERGCGIIVS